MRQRIIALLLALAVLASVCAVSALAEERTAPEDGKQTDQTASPAENVPETPEALPAETAPEEAQETEETASPSLAGPDLAENVTIQPDALGEVSFANVERRMRENNLQLLTLEQSVLTIEDIDYDKLYDQLWQQLNDIARAQWGLVQASNAMHSLSQIPGSGVTYSDYEYHTSYDQLDRAYAAVREQFDALKEGDMQKDNADVVRQLNNLQDQIVMAGESLYAALTAMEGQGTGLRQQLEGLDRTVEEMELRYQLGQISAMQLAEVKSGRTALESGLATLRMNVRIQAPAGDAHRRGADRGDRPGAFAGSDGGAALTDGSGEGPGCRQGEELRALRCGEDPGGRSGSVQGGRRLLGIQ